MAFSTGALEGIVAHHGEAATTDEIVELAAALLEASARGDSDRARPALDQLCKQTRIVTLIDPLLRTLSTRGLDRSAVRSDARWLLEHGEHRGAVRLGVALLGVTGVPADAEDLLTVGRHEAFTSLSVDALSRLLEDPEVAVWQLARSARGWDKVHAVECLACLDPHRQDVRDWLLRYGCPNEIMDEYLAYPCATAGRLREALTADYVDDPLLDGALTIVCALIEGGPAGDINDYDDAESVLCELIALLEARCDTLERLYAVGEIERWLVKGRQVLAGDARSESARAYAEELAEQGWTIDRLDGLIRRCGALFGRPDWPEQVRAAFAAGDGRDRAWSLSRRLGVDLWDAARNQLEAQPDQSLPYDWLTRTPGVPRERIADVMRFAESRLPLDRLARGPGIAVVGEPREELRQANEAINSLLAAMKATGVLSDRIISAGLRSPVIRTRTLAMRVLDAHPDALDGALTSAALAALDRDEPNDRVRERLRALRRPA